MNGLASEREGLLRAVCANPDDSGARLVYADWLEDHGQPERAEFIRLQCRRVSGVCPCLYGVPDCPDPACQAAAARERELFDLLEADGEWGESFPGLSVYTLTALLARLLEEFSPYAGREYALAQHMNCPHVVVCRGFPMVLGCPADFWDAHGPALVCRHPLTSVRLTDRAPYAMDGQEADRWEWRGEALADGLVSCVLPFAFYSRLQPSPGPEFSAPYQGQEAAIRAASTACLAWARSQAASPA